MASDTKSQRENQVLQFNQQDRENEGYHCILFL